MTPKELADELRAKHRVLANQENIRKWVAALRSGDYSQCRGVLSDGVGYCCLGVACEVAIASGVGVVKIVGDGVFYDDYSTRLPDKVVRWLGVENPNPSVGKGSVGEPLSVWNDGFTECGGRSIGVAVDPHTFSEIADLIENQYLIVPSPDESKPKVG